MPVVQTTQTPTKASTNDRIFSYETPSSKRVPLRALQMLTQSVSPLTRDYVQPFPISEGTDQKKSPLALLAATCSSIGKTEAKQESREPMTARHESPKTITSSNSTSVDGRSSMSKISADETKSSFKPYKHDESKESHHNSTGSEKPGFRAPSKDTADSLHRKSPDFNRTKTHVGSFSPFQYPYLADSANAAHCFYQTQNRMCGMYFDMAGHQPSSHHSCLKTDCAGNCGSALLPPTSLAPTNPSTPSIRPIFPSPTVSTPSTVKSHGLPSSGASRSNPLYPRCNCGYCNQVAPVSQEGNLKGVQHPGLAQYHRDYLQVTSNCQDPYCTNCKSQVLPGGTTGGSPRGCGPHCFHHHHESSPTVVPNSLSSIAPTMSHLYPYGFMLRPQSDQANTFVCNWVQDSKNCGKNFATSDELLQHLRTHTSAANATPLHTPCNIPGCPCNLKAIPGSTPRLHSARYHPYFIPSPGAFHSSSFHNAIAPYTSPHGIPYGSPFKPY